MTQYAFIVYAICLITFFVLLSYLHMPSRILMTLTFSLIVITLLMKPHPMGIIKSDKSSIAYYGILIATMSYIIIYAVYYAMTDNMYCKV